MTRDHKKPAITVDKTGRAKTKAIRLRDNEFERFHQILSPFLAAKLTEAEKGTDAKSRKVATILKRQYLPDPRERQNLKRGRERHYYADVQVSINGVQLLGVERMYRRLIVLQLTMKCAARCRWCLRRFYPKRTLRDEDLKYFVQYCDDLSRNDEIREVLVSGGDPFLLPNKLNLLIDQLVEEAPGIKVIRIGTRVPVQAPELVDEQIVNALRKRPGIRLEVGVTINHALELWPETRSALLRIRDTGSVLYHQSVLLAGVNDDEDSQIELFDELRYLGVEPHYLFHAVPIKGCSHHRTSVLRGLQIIRDLCDSGRLSGRGKPKYVAMTDIGKISLNEGTILDRKDGQLFLQSNYSYEERHKWNPGWEMPRSATVDEYGRMRVWYLDGGTDC